MLEVTGSKQLIEQRTSVENERVQTTDTFIASKDMLCEQYSIVLCNNTSTLVITSVINVVNWLLTVPVSKPVIMPLHMCVIILLHLEDI